MKIDVGNHYQKSQIHYVFTHAAQVLSKRWRSDLVLCPFIPCDGNNIKGLPLQLRASIGISPIFPTNIFSLLLIFLIEFYKYTSLTLINSLPPP